MSFDYYFNVFDDPTLQVQGGNIYNTINMLVVAQYRQLQRQLEAWSCAQGAQPVFKTTCQIRLIFKT